MELRNNIRKYRREQQRSPKEVARVAGVSLTAVQRWERNEMQPKPSIHQKLAEFFGVTQDELFYYITTPSPDGNPDPRPV